MKINFSLNKKYALLHAIKWAQFKEPFSGWKNFVLKIEKKIGPQLFYFLKGEPEWQILGKKNLKEITLKIEKLFEDLLKAPQSKRLFEQIEQYQKWIRKEWKQKGRKVLSELKKITGLSLGLKKVTVYLTHPNLYNGVNFPEKNIICWGHPEEWENYSLVYLAHEILHLELFKKFKNEKIGHALIELAVDNELRIRLNGKGVYFKEKGKRIGHPSLRKLEKKLLPFWKEYLREKSSTKNILQLEKKCSQIIK